MINSLEAVKVEDIATINCMYEARGKVSTQIKYLALFQFYMILEECLKR